MTTLEVISTAERTLFVSSRAEDNKIASSRYSTLSLRPAVLSWCKKALEFAYYAGVSEAELDWLKNYTLSLCDRYVTGSGFSVEGFPILPAPQISISGVTRVSISTSWTKPSRAQGYRLQVSNSSSGPWEDLYIGDLRNFTEGNLSSGQTRHYRVQATAPFFSPSAWSQTQGTTLSDSVVVHYFFEDAVINPTLQKIQTSPSLTVTSGSNISVDYSANVSPNYLYFCEPVTEPVKSLWYVTDLNKGSIAPVQFFNILGIYSGFRVYITSYRSQQPDPITFKI